MGELCGVNVKYDTTEQTVFETIDESCFKDNWVNQGTAEIKEDKTFYLALKYNCEAWLIDCAVCANIAVEDQSTGENVLTVSVEYFPENGIHWTDYEEIDSLPVGDYWLKIWLFENYDYTPGGEPDCESGGQEASTYFTLLVRAEPVPQYPEADLVSYDVQPRTVKVGDPIDVSVTVENIGAEKGWIAATAYVNGTKVIDDSAELEVYGREQFTGQYTTQNVGTLGIDFYAYSWDDATSDWVLDKWCNTG